MSVTIKEIARKTEVAISTVSNVLNNPAGPFKASEATRNRILQTAKALNYTPNLTARALKQGKTLFAGVILEKVVSSFVPQILQGIEDELHKNGYNTILCTYGSLEDFSKRMDTLCKKRLDGVITFPLSGKPYANKCEEIVRKGIPVVSICNKLNIPDVKSVYVNEEKIGKTAAEYLISLGHKNIMIIEGGRKKCFQACRTVFQENNLDYNEKLHLEDFTSFEDGKKALRFAVEQNLEATAILAYSDIVAAGIIYEAKRLEINIPENVSVMGIDNLPLCEMINPQITTVAQPQYEQGSNAAAMLLRMINGDKNIKDVIMEPFLVKRSSCCSPKHSNIKFITKISRR